MLTIKQKCNCKIIHDIKTVEWLIENTTVRTFDNIDFTGYQRKVNEKHVSNIVKYLNNNEFYLPTSITCSSDEEVTENTKLNIVDGQHRVEAFKRLKEDNINRYNEIKDCQLSVVILEKPSEELEVDTFITINKTSRKVDTSLAYILKNKINKHNTNSNYLNVAKKEFLSVELAIDINKDEKSLWYNKILLEGNPTKNSYETISLNSFVRSTRVLINYLDKRNIVQTNWSDDNELRLVIEKIKNIYLNIWTDIEIKWPNLFNDKSSKSTVIQGAIGVSSINKYIIIKLKSLECKECNIVKFNSFVDKWIENVNINEDFWYKGNKFSKFSSESGFNMVAKMLSDMQYD